MIEPKSIESGNFREEYGFYGLQKVKKDAERRSKYNNKKDKKEK